ncbi:MAG TPA: head GIN domain-containing protein [Polyangiaceae bacterium]|nr:head GIN domain-containing protein [Polyangiaceae bacterium]
MALVGSVIGCVESVDGDGMRTQETRDARGFAQVNARGGLDVTISEGDFSVVVDIDQNLQKYVTTSVRNDTLTVEVDDVNLGTKVDGPHVIISMPELSDVETTGDGELIVNEFDAEVPLSLELTGDGSLFWTGRATDLDVVLAGRGNMSIEGTAEDTEFVLRGDGTIDARDLVADSARIALDGTGSLSLTVNGRVDATAANGGSIDLYGRVVEGDIDLSTGATIEAH